MVTHERLIRNIEVCKERNKICYCTSFT